MKKLIITDLDDTLYSWIEFFIPAFYEMVDCISKITGIKSNILLQEYKNVHQIYGSVEYPFATLQLPSIKEKYANCSDSEIKDILGEAFHRFNSYRKHNLRLYPEVYNTLNMLYQKGIKIIGYTDSTQENAFYRLKRLEIDSLFEKIYLSYSSFQGVDSISKLEKLEFVSTKKPDPDTLLQICNRENMSVEDVVYIGDSLTKDIYMAHCAGIESIWVNYGNVQPEMYNKLVAISHWTQEDFSREQEIKRKCSELNIKPNYVINNFKQVLDIVL